MADQLAKVFDVEEVAEVVAPDNSSVMVPPEEGEDYDHLFARAKHYELSQKGSEALELAMKVAKESENPRAIEVLGQLIKNLSEVNKSLLSLNKDKADAKTAKKGQSLTPSNGGQTVQNQQNIIFTGNSSDLNKLIAEQLKKV